MKLDPREARHVLRQCDFAALATHSAKMPGYPFVSHAPFALDGAGQPILLLSRLAEHTRNLAEDPRASLMVSVPGPDPQAQPRLTLMGDLMAGPVSLSLQDRYLRYHPDAAAYLGFGDFRFYRLTCKRVRLVGGFARAGWVEPAEWQARPLAEGEEAGLLGRLKRRIPTGWQILGLDWEGMDVRTADRGRLRLTWQPVPGNLDDFSDAAAGALAQDD